MNVAIVLMLLGMAALVMVNVPIAVALGVVAVAAIWMAQESAVKLFVAGIIPGAIGGFALMGLCYYYARKHNFPVEQRFDLCKLAQAAREAAWALVMPVVILGGIFAGFVTATEGAALAVLTALVIAAVIYRDLDLKSLYQACIDSAIQTAVVMLLVAASALVGVFLTESQLPQRLAAAMLDLTTNPYLVLLLLNVFFLILGMFLHSAAAIILTVPIVLPLVHQVHIDPVHFGLVLTLNLAIGQQTPPVASVLIASCSIAKSDIWQTTKANIGFIGVLMLVLLLCTYVPWFSLVLINFFYGG